METPRLAMGERVRGRPGRRGKYACAFRERIGNGLGTDWERIGNGLGTDWERTGNGLGTDWERIGNGLGTDWERIGNGLGTDWERTGNGLGTVRGCTLTAAAVPIMLINLS